MELDKEYRIEKDSYGITLVRETIIQAIDKDTRKPIAGKNSIKKEVFYLGNLEQCLRTYLKLKIEPSKNIEDCLKKIEEANENITKAFKNIKL